MPRKELPPPDECANCGAEIPRQARSCPECGADELTGWRENEQTRYDGLDLPESAFESDETANSDESAQGKTGRINGVPWYWWCVGVALVVALIVTLIGLQ